MQYMNTTMLRARYTLLLHKYRAESTISINELANLINMLGSVNYSENLQLQSDYHPILAPDYSELYRVKLNTLINCALPARFD
jgi:hypothetical protein